MDEKSTRFIQEILSDSNLNDAEDDNDCKDSAKK